MNLYRRSWLWASIIVLALSVLALSAPAFQRSSPHKLRATALLELTTDASGTVTSRLYPITILADGRFQDATIYESKPRPLALGTGVVYEAQKTGTPVGYLTINGAINSLQGWVGEGKWQPPKDTKASSTTKPATPPAAPADDRPILHRGSGDAAPPSPQPEQSPSTAPPSDDRPVLHRSGTDTSQQPSSTPPANQPDAEVPPDPNRPVLRHRTPSGEDVESTPPATKTTTTPTATAPLPQTVTTKPLPAPNLGVQTFVAVSDAQPSDIRSYEFNWKPDEKQKIEAKMRKLALAQLPGENSQTNAHSLANVVVRSFDLDMSNDAVVVITAEAPGADLSTGTKTARGSAAPKTPPDKFVSRYITVIARVDIDGNPQKLASSITDSSRLDVAPRLELIDAVDVDGDGLAELVFREYNFDQKSFLIYGVGHGSVTKVFEGATVPLK
ncbi:MAG TPA: hypothetical protein VI685_16860 [Candidatus Angelobacter sp.]